MFICLISPVPFTANVGLCFCDQKWVFTVTFLFQISWSEQRNWQRTRASLWSASTKYWYNISILYSIPGSVQMFRWPLNTCFLYVVISILSVVLAVTIQVLLSLKLDGVLCQMFYISILQDGYDNATFIWTRPTYACYNLTYKISIKSVQ